MSGRAEDRPLVALSISRQQERKAAWSSRASASGPDRRKEKRFTSGSRASTGQGAENSSGNQNISLARENEKLRRQNQRLQEELEKAHIVIDVQKKVARLLGHPIAEVPNGEK